MLPKRAEIGVLNPFVHLTGIVISSHSEVDYSKKVQEILLNFKNLCPMNFCASQKPFFFVGKVGGVEQEIAFW